MIAKLLRTATTVAALCLLASVAAAPAAAERPWPATKRGVAVFNDQLTEGMSDAQVRFAARNYVGTQKMVRREADRLRAVDPASSSFTLDSPSWRSYWHAEVLRRFAPTTPTACSWTRSAFRTR